MAGSFFNARNMEDSEGLRRRIFECPVHRALTAAGQAVLMFDRHGRFYVRRPAAAGGWAGQRVEKYNKNRILNALESTLVYLGKVVYFPPLSGQASTKRLNPARCCSSVVEHSLGKGEVVSSILINSTIYFLKIADITPPR